MLINTMVLDGGISYVNDWNIIKESVPVELFIETALNNSSLFVLKNKYNSNLFVILKIKLIKS